MKVTKPIQVTGTRGEKVTLHSVSLCESLKGSEGTGRICVCVQIFIYTHMHIWKCGVRNIQMYWPQEYVQLMFTEWLHILYSTCHLVLSHLDSPTWETPLHFLFTDQDSKQQPFAQDRLHRKLLNRTLTPCLSKSKNNFPPLCSHQHIHTHCVTVLTLCSWPRLFLLRRQP